MSWKFTISSKIKEEIFKSLKCFVCIFHIIKIIQRWKQGKYDNISTQYSILLQSDTSCLE